MAVREGLLVLLAGGERHGYQLKTDFESATGGVWSLNVGQVYTTLDRLVRDGLVAVEETHDEGADNGGPQKTYSLTAVGREEPADDPPPREELLLKILLAATRGPDHALDVITRNRTALTGVLQSRRRAGRARAAAAASSPSATSDGADPLTELATRMVEDALVIRTEADLRWLDQCEAHVIAARATADGH